MKITKKVILLDAPFSGTRVRLCTAEGSTAWGIYAWTLAEGCEAVSVDWGDGTEETVAGNVSELTHDYGRAGRFAAVIGDGVSSLRLSSPSATSAFGTTYPAMVRAVASNAQLLETFDVGMLFNSVNLGSVDFRKTRIATLGANCFRGCTALSTLDGLPRSIETLGARAFYDCTGLTGRVEFPNVWRTTATAGEVSMPFVNCTGLREIHFAAAHEEAIRGWKAFETDPKLGAPGATVHFDL